MTDLDTPCSMKEALAWLGKSRSWGDALKRRGFQLVARRTTRRALLEFAAKCPNPCSRKVAVSNGKQLSANVGIASLVRPS